VVAAKAAGEYRASPWKFRSRVLHRSLPFFVLNKEAILNDPLLQPFQEDLRTIISD
jgi:hypothetical protein